MKMINKLLTDFVKKHTYSNTSNLVLIWGVLSVEERLFENPNLFSLNDIELLYDNRENKYWFEVKTVYMYDNPSAQYVYLKGLLDEFTKWMNENDCDTTLELPLWRVFAKGIDINTRFDSIEEAYAAFKMMVNGFCALQKEND